MSTRTPPSKHALNFASHSSVDDMWTFFKTGLMGILDSHIPSKTSSSCFTHPWISTKTRHLSRRKARTYRKAKFTNNNKDWCNYKSLKPQSEMRRAHHSQPGPYLKFLLICQKQETRNHGYFTTGFLHSRSNSKAEILN